MRGRSLVVIGGSTLLGLAGSALAFSALSGSQPVVPAIPPPPTSGVVVPDVVPGTQFAWAPCEPPAVLDGDRCVVERVETVVLPPPAAPAAPPAGAGDPDESDDRDDDSADDRDDDRDDERDDERDDD